MYIGPFSIAVTSVTALQLRLYNVTTVLQGHYITALHNSVTNYSAMALQHDYSVTTLTMRSPLLQHYYSTLTYAAALCWSLRALH